MRGGASVRDAIRGFYAVLDRDDEELARALVGEARVLQVRIKPRPRVIDPSGPASGPERPRVIDPSGPASGPEREVEREPRA